MHLCGDRLVREGSCDCKKLQACVDPSQRHSGIPIDAQMDE